MALRKTCSACGADDFEWFLDLGTSPIADAYAASADEAKASPRYPLALAVCRGCKLVQLMEVLDDLFGSGYSFYSSASPPLSAYHAAYAADLIKRYTDQAAQGVLEIGCNDGDMLRHFAAFPSFGVDPATGPVAVAMARGLDVTEAPFTFDLARKSLVKYGLIIANHVLAHVADVQDMLAGIAHLLAPNGVAVIEVQYLPDLLVNNAFDLVYHEHRNFFSLRSLVAAARLHGLIATHAELTDRQGGSLRVTFGRSWDAHPSSGAPAVERIYRSERWLNDLSAYAGMQGRAERIRTRLLEMIGEHRDRGDDVALYGAPAKATTLLSFCGLGADDLPFCWDTTPAKQGRFIPGAAIPIYAPGFRCPSTFLLASWNYVNAIMCNNPGFGWLVPFPAPVDLAS